MTTRREQPQEPSRCPTCGWPSRRLPANTSSEPDCTDPFHGGASQKPYHAPNCNHIKRDMIPRREIYRHVERIAGMTVTQIDYDCMGEPFTKPDAKPADIFAHVLRAIEDFEPSSPPAQAGKQKVICKYQSLAPDGMDYCPECNGESGATAGTARELTPLEEALRRREDKNDVSTARHFYISTNQGILPSQVDWTPDGAMAFAEAYAAEKVRQATERAYDQGFTEGRRTGNIQLAEQVAQLRQDRDAKDKELEALRAGARTGMLKYMMAGDVGQFADKMRQHLQAEDWAGMNKTVTEFFNRSVDFSEARERAERGRE